MLLVKLIEPPCTERYARWCERSGIHSESPPTRFHDEPSEELCLHEIPHLANDSQSGYRVGVSLLDCSIALTSRCQPARLQKPGKLHRACMMFVKVLQCIKHIPWNEVQKVVPSM